VTRRAVVLNGAFDPLTFDEAVEAIFGALRNNTRGWVCTVNVATLMAMHRDAALQSFVDRALLVVPDGQPIVWCAKLFAACLPERVTGIDLVEALCRRAAAERKSVYLLGSTPPLVARAVETLRRCHPGLVVDGSHGHFQLAQSEELADAIRSRGVDLLFVGMGTPRQERYIEAQWDRLGVGVAIGVGGSIDVLAGARFRAHPWMRRAGLEWLVRMAQEPRRLTPRYLATNTMFCLMIGRTLLLRAKRWLLRG
jgi:N-acetylglucosaminyldiphosphoundecaprenol N-acetyl-beta-D-mannosaminyltransferase